MTTAIALLLSLTTAQAKTDAESEAEQRAQLRALLDKAPALLEVLSAPGASTPLTPVPVHRWTNDERDPHGEGLFVVWADRGRPVAGASIYPWNGRLIHDLESLSRESLVARRDGATVWQPPRGLAFAAIPNAESPADMPVARLRQMKALADTFAVTMTGWRGDDADREELRRLPKELYRYKPEDASLVDGALFAFVKGTDPEALLLIEAKPTSAGDRYEYALVRCTSGGLEARLSGRVIWSAPKHAPRRDPSQLSFTSAATLEEARSRAGLTSTSTP
jgi:hypothetical protein